MKAPPFRPIRELSAAGLRKCNTAATLFNTHLGYNF